MIIYLIGYSYGGKSTLGRQLAELIGYNFVDTDKAIEEKYKTTIPLFFKRYGEAAFRIVERQMLVSTGTMKDTVVATGGGTSCNDENIRFILEHGTAIHLSMSVDDIMLRMSHSNKTRPMLAGMTNDERRRFITNHLQQRLPFYSQAHLTIPALDATPEKIANALASL